METPDMEVKEDFGSLHVSGQRFSSYIGSGVSLDNRLTRGILRGGRPPSAVT